MPQWHSQQADGGAGAPSIADTAASSHAHQLTTLAASRSFAHMRPSYPMIGQLQALASLMNDSASKAGKQEAQCGRGAHLKLCRVTRPCRRPTIGTPNIHTSAAINHGMHSARTQALGGYRAVVSVGPRRFVMSCRWPLHNTVT
jgi:hypothetical protein